MAWRRECQSTPIERYRISDLSRPKATVGATAENGVSLPTKVNSTITIRETARSEPQEVVSKAFIQSGRDWRA